LRHDGLRLAQVVKVVYNRRQLLVAIFGGFEVFSAALIVQKHSECARPAVTRVAKTCQTSVPRDRYNHAGDKHRIRFSPVKCPGFTVTSAKTRQTRARWPFGIGLLVRWSAARHFTCLSHVVVIILIIALRPFMCRTLGFEAINPPALSVEHRIAQCEPGNVQRMRVSTCSSVGKSRKYDKPEVVI